VGSYEANRLGIYDMHGNVWEWCQDCYDKDYYTSSPTRDPLCLKGSVRVVRGGSWYDSGPICRSAYRRRDSPGYRYDYLGVRLALVVRQGSLAE
jgi:formylglycine-generating enzyme required for sulfatase activity